MNDAGRGEITSRRRVSPVHPTFTAALLMIGVVLFIVVASALSVLGG